MTDPVDPDALRARADENAEWAQVAFGLPNRDEDARELLLNADMFRAAADQLESVTAQRNQWAAQVISIEAAVDEHGFDDERGNGWLPLAPIAAMLHSGEAG